jgi:2-keto-4-pentenoate hydratase/2-oxohepta-3-ene-1,7-dioic acid hydratase in catechol pathway
VKLARICRGRNLAWAAITKQGAVDLTPLVGEGHGAIHRFLDSDGFKRLGEFASERPADIGASEILYAPLLPDPEKIICVGVNYHNRNEEYRDGSEKPDYPSLFMRSPTSFTGHGTPLVRPVESAQLDYEGEIVIVIGKGGRRIPRVEARSHIAGLTLMNEGTVRDWTRHAKFNVTQGKNFDRSGSIGPWLVGWDEAGSIDNLTIQTRVNGELRQDDSTANMIFGFDLLIEYISSFMTLKAGDVISTGTPTGAGVRFDPPRYLKPCDVVEITCPAIGTLHNDVVDG